MIENSYIKKILSLAIIASLLVLTFFLLKPFLLSMIMGVILAFIFAPVYNFIYQLVKSKNISSFLVCLLIILIIAVPSWFIIPFLLKESVGFFLAVQKTDLAAPLREFLPYLFASEELSPQISSFIYSISTKTTSFVMNYFSELVLELPAIFLHFIVVLFIFSFSIREKDAIINYIKNYLPFSKDVEKKIFEYFGDITKSVLYGQVIVGLVQGIFLGIGFFIFRVPNSLLLMLLSIFVSVFPFTGPFLVWIPVVLYLFFTGEKISAIGVLVFGLIASTIDNFLKPIIISKRVDLHPALVFIGMMGGLFLFGVLGLIIGPLILAYLLITLESYFNKKVPEIFIKKQN